MTEKNITSQDVDPIESQEWKEALNSIVAYEDTERAEFILQQLLSHARKIGVPVPVGLRTAYINTIPANLEAKLPKNEINILERLTNYIRWNAMAMVMRAGRKKTGLGGHLSSYASIATLVEVGLNYFFHADDLVFFKAIPRKEFTHVLFLKGG